jgi:hypothetical protein
MLRQAGCGDKGCIAWILGLGMKIGDKTYQFKKGTGMLARCSAIGVSPLIKTASIEVKAQIGYDVWPIIRHFPGKRT